MTFIKKNAGLLKSVRNWGVLGLVLALAVVASVRETTAVPEANTVKLQTDNTVVSKTKCPLVAWVGWVNINNVHHSLQGYQVFFYDVKNPNDPADDIKLNLTGILSLQNGQAKYSVSLNTLVEARVKVSYGILISNRVSCSGDKDPT